LKIIFILVSVSVKRNFIIFISVSISVHKSITGRRRRERRMKSRGGGKGTEERSTWRNRWGLGDLSPDDL